jgi:hypothetical protein
MKLDKMPKYTLWHLLVYFEVLKLIKMQKWATHVLRIAHL